MSDQVESRETLAIVNYKTRLLEPSLPPEEIARITTGIKVVHNQCALPPDLREALDTEPSQRSPEVNVQLAQYTNNGWLFGDSEPQVDRYITQSLKPKSKYKYLVVEGPNGQVVGYARLLLSKGEDVDDEDFTWTDNTVKESCRGPHVEIDEGAILPAARQTRNPAKQSPAVQLIRSAENFASNHKYPALAGWIITSETGSTFSDRPSVLLHQMLGFKRGGETDSFSEYTRATCFAKTF